MEFDLQSLFGLLCTAACTHWLRPRNSPLPSHSGSYTRVVLVSQDRRHLSVTPWLRDLDSQQRIRERSHGRYFLTILLQIFNQFASKHARVTHYLFYTFSAAAIRWVDSEFSVLRIPIFFLRTSMASSETCCSFPPGLEATRFFISPLLSILRALFKKI
jgi:hypothetical protein